MHTTTQDLGGRYRMSKEIHADVKYLKKPVIMGTKIIDGEKFYRGMHGKLYVMELFDRMFKVTKGVVKPVKRGK